MKKERANKVFWLDDLQWSMLKPHLPTKQTGPKRQDDRRLISGIVHVLQSGCRWQDCPPEYGPSTTVYNRYHRWSKRGIWEGIFRDLTSIVGTHDENSIDSTIVKTHRSASGKKGAGSEAIGRSRGGRTTKVHAATDEEGRPIAFLLTPGNASDIKAAKPLLEPLKGSRQLLGDTAYDSDDLQAWLKKRKTGPVIPNKKNRDKPSPFKKRRYRQRNTIERMFCRLKDARRIATRYDKSAQTYLNAICLISIVYWWLN
ncbi:MAG TPA: IS5 family transposase [Nitrospira sp.]|nr:IS5 family transposase [Nitrospira sp.]